MIVGIGTDLCQISRMRKMVESERFVQKIFTQAEIEYAAGHGDPARHFASAFAAREAFAKAGGWGLFRLGVKDCWVERTSRGPILRWNPKVGVLLEELGAINCHLSLSHEGDFALALLFWNPRMRLKKQRSLTRQNRDNDSRSAFRKARLSAFRWAGFLLALFVLVVARLQNPDISLFNSIVVVICFLGACILLVWVGKRMR